MSDERILQHAQVALEKCDLLKDYFTTKQLAAEIRNSPRTINRWHARRIGPPRTVIGRTILYRRDAVREWLASLERCSQRKTK